MWKVTSVFLLSLSMVISETIHFTNSVKHLKTTKNFTTYEVEVPGSKPITIIEANPEVANKLRPRPVSIQYRNSIGTTVEDHANVVKDDGMEPGSAKKTLYSPDLLQKFLKEYTEKLKNADSETRQKLNEISMINNKHAEKAETTTEQQDKDDQMMFSDIHERHGGNTKWYGDNRKSHPWNSKDGWVTMEAVPWSESKVSKWQSNTIKHSNGNRNKNSYQGSQWNEEPMTVEIPSRPKPSFSVTSPATSYYGNVDDDYNDNAYSPSRPNYATVVNEKPSKPAFESFYNRRYRPSEDYNRKSQSPYNPDYTGDTWYDHGFKKPQEENIKSPYASQSGDIITDGHKTHFPQHSQSNSYTTSTDRNRPLSYPENGNGEWVLISTTKGYQYPRRQGQRAMTFAPAPSALTHKSIKLTVLPMKNSLDMTTSHNGLIEVSSSTQTVEQSYQQQHQQKNHQHSNPQSTAAVSSSSPSTPAPPIRKRRVIPQFSLMRRDSMQDSSAVLAAVSAGMVPATLAVLAPMVLGRKRRSLGGDFPHPEQLLEPRRF